MEHTISSDRIDGTRSAPEVEDRRLHSRERQDCAPGVEVALELDQDVGAVRVGLGERLGVITTAWTVPPSSTSCLTRSRNLLASAKNSGPVDANDDHATRLDQPLVPLHIEVRIRLRMLAEQPDARIRRAGDQKQQRDRQLWDQKGSAIIETMSPQVMMIHAEVCGSILARAHARSGDRVAIAAYLGKSEKLDRAIADFADAYADQNELDYGALRGRRGGRARGRRKRAGCITAFGAAAGANIMRTG